MLGIMTTHSIIDKIMLYNKKQPNTKIADIKARKAQEKPMVCKAL